MLDRSSKYFLRHLFIDSKIYFLKFLNWNSLMIENPPRTITEYFMERVEPKAALKALRDSGYEVKDEEEAKKKLASILAGWLLEAGEEWDFFRFSSDV